MKRVLLMGCMAAVLCLGMTTSIRCPSDTVTVELVNDAGDDVDVLLVISSDQDISRDDLFDDGTEINEVLADEELFLVVRPCSELRAVAVDAVLEVIGGIGPIEDTDVLRIDEDFDCGDVVTFTFTSNNLRTDLEIDISVR